MTTKEWAQKLNGREYRAELTKEEIEQASEDGVIIALGASDDLLEITGMFDEEYDALDGTNIGFVEATWSPKDENGNVYASWHMESPLPHEHFNIYEDGELYCIGAVIKVDAPTLDKEFYKKLSREGFFEITDPYDFTLYIAYNDKRIMKRETVKYLHEDLSEDDIIKVLKALRTQMEE